MTAENLADASEVAGPAAAGSGAAARDWRGPDAGGVVRVAAPTERRNPASTDLDLMRTRDMLGVINEADHGVPVAVAAVLDEVAAAVDAGVAALRAGGRVHYFGAGTSGRLGVLDVAELRPTFNAPEHWFCPHLAGGRAAMWQAVEDAEDDDGAGVRDAAGCVRAGDLVLGLAASGRTPYVIGALRASRARGASTVLLSCDPRAGAAREVDIFIGVDTGAEVITGSTRMKAATAQKLVLNAFSTAVMVRLGRVYSNLMIGVVATNAKLRGRMISILEEATGHAEQECRQALTEADGDLRAALVALLSGASVADARTALRHADDEVRVAVARLGPIRP